MTAIQATALRKRTERFSASFSSTARGARLARLLTVEQLAAWGWAYDTELNQDAGILVAELAANAVLHGTAQSGRCFRLRIALSGTTLRIEVTDAQPESYPPCKAVAPSDEPAESGRGIQLVEALATRWGVEVNCPYGKTVWCEVALPHANDA